MLATQLRKEPGIARGRRVAQLGLDFGCPGDGSGEAVAKTHSAVIMVRCKRSLIKLAEEGAPLDAGADVAHVVGNTKAHDIRGPSVNRNASR